jgi:hypothetical protein
MPLQKGGRNLMTLENKIDMSDELVSSESVTFDGRHLHSSESSIKQNEAAVRVSVEAKVLKSAKVAYESYDPCLEKAEEMLSLWTEYMVKRKCFYICTIDINKSCVLQSVCTYSSCLFCTLNFCIHIFQRLILFT